MLENYFPILMFIVVGLVVGVAPLLLGGGLSRLLGVHRPDSEKLSPYECGFEAFEDARIDRKSTRLNSSHSQISYAVFCLKKKKLHPTPRRFYASYLYPGPAVREEARRCPY